LFVVVWGIHRADPMTHANAATRTVVEAVDGESTPPRWFSDRSPWNTPIARDVAVFSQSDKWMSGLQDSIAEIDINQNPWTPKVVMAHAKAPRGRVGLSNGWKLDSVPLPVSLAPSSDSDGHTAIIDLARGREYDFFRLARQGGQWQAAAGVVLRVQGSGWWNGTYSAGGVSGPWGARASGAALAGGLIRVQDAKAGVIPHALACAAPKQLIGPPVSPARTGDGSGGAGAMPMGSHLQLDPSLNISSLGLEPGEEMIARALQTYGAYIVDSSSGLACYAQNSSTLGSNPYPASWSNGISKQLISHMRVVTPPPPPVYDNRATLCQPHRLAQRSKCRPTAAGTAG
jgi:hypothetical protein